MSLAFYLMAAVVLSAFITEWLLLILGEYRSKLAVRKTLRGRIWRQEGWVQIIRDQGEVLTLTIPEAKELREDLDVILRG